MHARPWTAGEVRRVRLPRRPAAAVLGDDLEAVAFLLLLLPEFFSVFHDLSETDFANAGYPKDLGFTFIQEVFREIDSALNYRYDCPIAEATIYETTDLTRYRFVGAATKNFP